MKDKNREFEETGAFLDLMSKKERKRWEKEQSRLKSEEINSTEIKNNEIQENKTIEMSSNIQEDIKVELEEKTKDLTETTTNDLQPIASTITQEEYELELEKTRKLTELTQELTIEKQALESAINEEKETSFNPVIPLGITLIVLFSFYIYIVIGTSYTDKTFITINSIILLVLFFAFGLTALCNKKHVKLFAIFDLLIILGIIIFNGISITNYENIYNKVEEKTPTNNEEIVDDKPIIEQKDETTINEYNCSNEDNTITIELKEEKNYITYIKKTETLNDNDTAVKTSSYYNDITGINVNVEENIITIEFDFQLLDIDQYKTALSNLNEAYRLESDFSYIENNKINFEKYNNSELNNLTCIKKEN